MPNVESAMRIVIREIEFQLPSELFGDGNDVFRAVDDMRHRRCEHDSINVLYFAANSPCAWIQAVRLLFVSIRVVPANAVPLS
jgi:hypothetical protein